MKNFKLQLNNPPQGVYFPGMMVTGTVTAETDVPKDYKQIQVQLVGRADVHWSEMQSSGNSTYVVHYESDEHISIVLLYSGIKIMQEEVHFLLGFTILISHFSWLHQNYQLRMKELLVKSDIQLKPGC